MENKDFYLVEEKSIEYLRSYVNHDVFMHYFNHFGNGDGMHDFLSLIPINDDCRAYIDEYTARAEHFRSTLRPNERAFEECARVVMSDYDSALMYLCIGLFEDEICQPLFQ